MSKRLGIIVVALAVAGSALAGAEKEQIAPKEGSGVFISATPKADGGTLDLKVALDNEGEKVFELPARVALVYKQKGDRGLLSMIWVVGQPAPEAKRTGLVAMGTLAKAEIQGTNVLLTLKVGEGYKATKQQFTMVSRLRITYQDDGGKLTVQHITPIGIGSHGKREKGEKPAKRERPGKGVPPANELPENF